MNILLGRVDYKLGVGALIVALIIAIIVWTIVYLEYRKVVRQEKINKIIKRISERAEDSGNKSDKDIEELATVVDIGHLRLLDAHEL
nr:vpu protein [Human immunodeficiency virus 1]